MLSSKQGSTALVTLECSASCCVFHADDRSDAQRSKVLASSNLAPQVVVPGAAVPMVVPPPHRLRLPRVAAIQAWGTQIASAATVAMFALPTLLLQLGASILPLAPLLIFVASLSAFGHESCCLAPALY